jgi:hypothetical protein
MKKLIILLSCLFISLSSQATLLSIELNQSSYQVGDTLIADFIISDIEEDALGFQKLLASFDFNVSWDDTILEYASASFGNKLDVGAGSDHNLLDVMNDSLGLTEISYAWWDELLQAQDGLSHFVLASLNFNVTGTGSGELNLTQLAFGDDFGDAFTDVNSRDKAYSVASGNPVDVPEPMSVILMLIGLCLMGFSLSARPKKQH